MFPGQAKAGIRPRPPDCWASPDQPFTNSSIFTICVHLIGVLAGVIICKFTQLQRDSNVKFTVPDLDNADRIPRPNKTNWMNNQTI